MKYSATEMFILSCVRHNMTLEQMYTMYFNKFFKYQFNMKSIYRLLENKQLFKEYQKLEHYLDKFYINKILKSSNQDHSSNNKHIISYCNWGCKLTNV